MSIFDVFKQLQKPAPTGQVEYIIVGLGNPGSKYENTRHNAGFMAVDTLAKRFDTSLKQIKFKSLCGDVMLAGKRCLLMKPSTYMNNSGEAVVEALNFYKVPTDKLIVIFDDVSLDPGKLRIRRKGSDGGHNGIKSIIYLTGKDDFPRVKIGIGAKPHSDYDLAAWVLSKFTKPEGEQLQVALSASVSACELIAKGEIDKAMNQYNN
ncbi:MAG TPA: aminoacyl-tRNA hydrolase [Oscillospiraceae bacterium]|nr:aminoacyl-tRNA hydrolase [Oscillospiraceae bacterium]